MKKVKQLNGPLKIECHVLGRLQVLKNVFNKKIMNGNGGMKKLTYLQISIYLDV